jgi:hypothetical protein
MTFISASVQQLAVAVLATLVTTSFFISAAVGPAVQVI